MVYPCSLIRITQLNEYTPCIWSTWYHVLLDGCKGVETENGQLLEALEMRIKWVKGDSAEFKVKTLTSLQIECKNMENMELQTHPRCKCAKSYI